ncbi:KTSC domain-containing protein [Herbaspirillum huttiense]|uniref:KTSC domain-containing protein n=2 Tax=Herbaspirillum huttiense TaxID=863372 RepID=A0AAJ2HGP0_9BURK|nr:KTSC domain-containing protein [Herbaspirillum huttiense]MDR9839413.1 KTSC domain-containing protein [Herbaspirillum huttiense]
MITAEAIQQPTIAMDAVESSQIAAIGHDAATNTLAIQFPGKGDKPGSVYHYANFTADDFKAFQEAESKGSFFGKNIKKNTEKYPYTRIS